MPKILEEKYPLGSLKNHKTAGRYVDGYLYNNLSLLAEKIVDDMTFLGIGFSSTLEVGTGKSVLFTQVGEIWSHLMKKKHNLDIPFTVKNIVWRPKDLIERAFQVPRYSCILVDEWEDAHYWSELGMTLRQFFRKCRQLNLFILLIIPNFFQLPMNYALGRSIFAIDIKFQGNFERGYMNFYDFEKKRELYIKGKKTHNYHVTKPSFSGRFLDGYGVPEQEYRDAKLRDLENIEDEGIKKKPLTEKQQKGLILRRITAERKFLSSGDGITYKKLAEVLGVSESTIGDWITQGGKALEEMEASKKKESLESSSLPHYASFIKKHIEEENENRLKARNSAPKGLKRQDLGEASSQNDGVSPNNLPDDSGESFDYEELSLNYSGENKSNKETSSDDSGENSLIF